MRPAVLTAISLICMVLTIEVTITAPQLESTVSISTGELVRFTGWWGPCVDQAGGSQWSFADQNPVPTLPAYMVLTTAQFVAAILAVFLTITEVIFGDAVPTAACGLLGSTHRGHSNTG